MLVLIDSFLESSFFPYPLQKEIFLYFNIWSVYRKMHYVILQLLELRGWGLERCLPLGFWVFPSTFAK